MNRTLRLPLLVGILIGWPLSGAAQDIPSPYRFIETTHEAGVFAGLISPGAGALGLGPADGPVFGARYAIELAGPLSLEGVARGIPTTRDVLDPRRAEGNRKVGEADVLLASLDARAKFSLPGRRTWHGLSPFVLAGAGVAWDGAADAEVDETLLPQDRFDFGTSFLVLLGTGVRWLPRDDIQVRADLGLDLWQLETPDGYLDTDRTDISFEDPPPESEWVAAPSVTLGISFRW